MLPVPAIRAISFDLDDTLWPVQPVIQRAEAELWAWLGANYPRICARFSADDAFELRRECAKLYPDMAHDYRFLRKKTVARMAREAGYDESLSDAAFEVFDHWRNQVDLFPDVVPALESLSGRYVIIALTNGNACLDRIGLGHFFDHVVTAAGAGYAKPSPRIFDHAMSEASMRPEHVLHVGDHPELDIEAAAAVGMQTAWVNRNGLDWPGHLPEAQREYRDLERLSRDLTNDAADPVTG